jgi:hypothetical protein
VKSLLIFSLLFGYSVNAAELTIVNAAELTIVNHTGADMRITQLRNRCDGFLITEDKPVYLKNNESYVVKKVTPVVQTYTICGSGFCSSSAMGMKKAAEYTLEAVMDGRYISGKGIPDHWVGNLECPK